MAKMCVISNSFINSKVNSFKHVAGNVMASFPGKKKKSKTKHFLAHVDVLLTS